ncbi:hypothetical protein ACQ5SK_12675 [Bradyrhizobium japonicum]
MSASALQRSPPRSGRLNRRSTNLEWVRDQRPGYATALNSLNIQTERLNRATEAIAADRNRSATASADLQQKSNQLAMSVERQAAARKRSADLEALRAALGPWKASTDRLAEIRRQETTLNQTLLELRAEEPTLQAQLDASTPQRTALERVIADADRSQSELRQLLSQLQKHITDGNCPLCGVDHGNQDELVRHIQGQMTLDSAGRHAPNSLGCGSVSRKSPASSPEIVRRKSPFKRN